MRARLRSGVNYFPLMMAALALVCGFAVVIPVTAVLSQDLPANSRARTAVRFELPDSAVMQERAGLTLSAAFIGRSDTPSWVARPSTEWMHMRLLDSAGKVLLDRSLSPFASGRTPPTTPTVVYSRLGFPFEVLPRCTALVPGRYRLEIRYNSPGTDRVDAIDHRSSVALTVASESPVPLRHLTLKVPDQVRHDDFRNPAFGVSVQVTNDGCERQQITPFLPDAVSVEGRAPDGRALACKPAITSAAPAPVVLEPSRSWGTFIPFSGRCNIPIPDATRRMRYRMHLRYRGEGWTGPTLTLNHSVDLELANLPHSSPGPIPR